MLTGIRKMKTIKNHIELEKMIRPIKPRKDSQFHLKSCDKPDYTYLLEVMSRNRIKNPNNKN